VDLKGQLPVALVTEKIAIAPAATQVIVVAAPATDTSLRQDIIRIWHLEYILYH
jgi:hypothetical protein